MKTPTPHPSRTAPLCGNCKHYMRLRSTCNHPSTPACPINGGPTVSIHDMRTASASLIRMRDITPCGPDGTLFEDCDAIRQPEGMHFDLKQYSKDDLLAAEVGNPSEASRAIKIRLRRSFDKAAHNVWIDLNRLPHKPNSPTPNGRVHYYWGNSKRQDANGSVQAELDALGVDRKERSGTTLGVHAQEDDGVSVFGSFEDLSDALSCGAAGSHRDHIDGPFRVVGIVVRREDVHALLPGLRDLQASIGRHDNCHPQRPAIDQGVECQVVGAVSDGDQGTDDLQTFAPPVLRPHSSFRAAEIRDWADWVGNPVVIVVQGEPA